MNPVPPPFAAGLLQATFAANPEYELVLFDRLSSAERETLAALRSDPDLYGVLRPRDRRSGSSIKAVDRETALLFLTLTQPGELPSYVGALLGEGAHDAVSRLVYDGVLGIAAAGEIRSGGAAHALLCQEAAPEVGRGLPARLSDAALRYAGALVRLGTDDPATLSSRLYAYHRVLASPRWRRRRCSPPWCSRSCSGSRSRPWAKPPSRWCACSTPCRPRCSASPHRRRHTRTAPPARP